MTTLPRRSPYYLTDGSVYERLPLSRDCGVDLPTAGLAETRMGRSVRPVGKAKRGPMAVCSVTGGERPALAFRSTSTIGRKRGVRNPRRSERAFHSGSARCQWRDTGSISLGKATRVTNTRIHSCHVDGERPSGSARQQRYAGHFPTMSIYLVFGLPLPMLQEERKSGECQGQLVNALSALKWSAPAQHRTATPAGVPAWSGTFPALRTPPACRRRGPGLNSLGYTGAREILDANQYGNQQDNRHCDHTPKTKPFSRDD